MKNLQDAAIDNVFFWINPVEKYFLRCYINRGKVSFGCSARSAIYYQAGSQLCKQILCEWTRSLRILPVGAME
jgi:hypothetical protein